MRKPLFALSCVLACAGVAGASPIALYSNLAVDGKMAAASRPDLNPALKEIETADDFVVGGTGAAVTEVKFIGLLTEGATPLNVDFTNLEFYRVFPNDSTTPADGRVPTRVNSPSDVAFTEVSSPGIASLTATTLNASFTASNSVKNGINPFPGQTTGGEGSVTGTEVLFDAVLTSPILLSPDHYFFVPQLDTTTGSFYWLSASRPIAPPGTQFPAGFTDLQAWIRNSDLDPDWLRIGTDIVGGNPAPTFNMAFEIDGEEVAVPVPEPSALLLLGTSLAFIARRLRRRVT